MEAIKGQNSLIPAIMMTAITTSGFLLILNSASVISGEVDYNSGDYNTISETKLRADAYERRTQKELNYSTNIIALRNGANAGAGDWQYNIPSFEEDLKPAYLNNVRDHLETQNNVRRCSTPSIESIDIFDSNISKFETEINDAFIKCDSTDDGTVTAETTVNISDSFRVQNPRNRYLKLAEYSEIFANAANDNISKKNEEEKEDQEDDSDFWTAEGYGSECGDSQEAVEDAKRSAEFFLPSPDVAENAYDPVEKPEYFKEVNLDTERVISFSTSVPDTDSCGEYGEKTYYNAEATAEIDELKVRFKYKDSNRTVINSNGEFENILFDFTYRVRP